MVLLAEKNLPQTAWTLGRIMEVIPGNDGILWVARIKTSNGILVHRPNKLSVLPIHQENVHFGGVYV